MHPLGDCTRDALWLGVELATCVSLGHHAPSPVDAATATILPWPMPTSARTVSAAIAVSWPID